MRQGRTLAIVVTRSVPGCATSRHTSFPGDGGCCDEPSRCYLGSSTSDKRRRVEIWATCGCAFSRPELPQQHADRFLLVTPVRTRLKPPSPRRRPLGRIIGPAHRVTLDVRQM